MNFQSEIDVLIFMQWNFVSFVPKTNKQQKQKQTKWNSLGHWNCHMSWS